MSCDKLAFVSPITCLDCKHSSSGLKFNISYSGNPSMVHGPSNLSEMFLPCAPIIHCTFAIKAKHSASPIVTSVLQNTSHSVRVICYHPCDILHSFVLYLSDPCTPRRWVFITASAEHQHDS